MNIRHALCGVPFAILFLLSGCAVSPAERTAMPAGQVQSDVINFTLSGRLGVRHREESFSGSLDWTASSDDDELLISGPLGQGVASMSRSSAGVIMTPAGKEPIRAASAEDLTESVLGFRLPLAGLRYWVQGRADPARLAEKMPGADGLIKQLRQDGWVIDYLQYRDNRPRKIHVTRDRGELEIRLVIDEWLTR